MQQDHAPKTLPPLTKSDSSVIAEYGYDEKAKSLFIRFVHGRKLWRYDNFPADLYQTMREAISVGKFFNQRIVKTYTGVYLPEKE